MTLDEFRPLTRAEERVIAGLLSGHVIVLGDGKLPSESAGPDRQVGARLIRWLALGAPGDDAVQLPEKGLQIEGALVVSDGDADPALGEESTAGLDLEGCRVERDLNFWNCRFVDRLILLGARMQTLNLQGSAIPGLAADRLTTRGSLFLRQVRATGAVRLVGARVGGNLTCVGGRFGTGDGAALIADGIETEGDVFLRGVEIRGETRLLGARVGGDLSCDGGRFDHPGHKALNASGARISGALFWREGSRAEGAVDLTGAEIGSITDDPECWPGAVDLLLDRCRYGAFTGKGVDADSRIRWLDLQTAERWGNDFWPQPWEQCATVLREMGHAEEARQVLIAKEERQRAVRREIVAARLDGARLRRRLNAVTDVETFEACGAEAQAYEDTFEYQGDPRLQAYSAQVLQAPVFQRARWDGQVESLDALTAQVAAKADRLGTRGASDAAAAQWAVTEAWLELAGLRVRDAVLRVFLDYGLRPLRAVQWLVAMWLGGAVLFGVAWGDHGFKPNNAFILRSAEWAGCAEGRARRGEHPSTLDCYLVQPEAAGYPGFNGLLYSADTLVPVVDLEVQDYWVPDEEAAPWARAYLWVHIAMGWFLALLAVAGFSGLVDTRSTKS